MLSKQLQAALDRRRRLGTLRNLTLFPSAPAPSPSDSSAAASTSKLIDFSSNDYLSLSTDVEVRRSFVERLQRDVERGEQVLGSTGSRLLDGNSNAHEELEHRLAHHFRAPSALLFNSGFDANASLLSTLPQPGDVVLYDSLMHASAHEGLRTSRAEAAVAFAHSDVGDLERKLGALLRPEEATLGGLDEEERRRKVDRAQRLREGKANVFVVVESVYSMDGDLCPLRSIVELLERSLPSESCHLIVDEAHGTGVYGDRGEGLCVELGLQDRVALRLVTFGKAFGSSGAAVLCSPLIRHFLINYARPLVFSTAIPYSTLVSIHCSLDAMCGSSGPSRFSRLFTNTRLLVTSLIPLNALPISAARLPAELVDTLTSKPSPIVPILTPYARELAAHLREHGFLARSICYPTVPKGEDRVRICVHADNRPQDVVALASCVREWSAREVERSREKDSARL